jgi:hypothetical protein
MWGLTHWDMKIKPLLVGFVVPAQPVRASKPPSGPDWVHEIKHDGYRLNVRRDGPTVRLYTRNANDWTVRLPAIATAAQTIEPPNESGQNSHNARLAGWVARLEEGDGGWIVRPFRRRARAEERQSQSSANIPIGGHFSAY